MGKYITEILPPVDQFLSLEPEEIGMFILDYLYGLPNSERGPLNRYNFTLLGNEQWTKYAGSKSREEIAHLLMEGWAWLDREGMIALRPGEQGEWIFVTRKGRALRESGNFDAYKKAAILPKENLDPRLIHKVYPLFIRGDYDTAVFQSYKEVEIRVREKAGLPSTEIGVALMRTAFQPDRGPLRDAAADPGERQAIMDLFAGAVGLFKNPTSHRDVNFNDPAEVAELILFANYLLRLVGRK